MAFRTPNPYDDQTIENLFLSNQGIQFSIEDLATQTGYPIANVKKIVSKRVRDGWIIQTQLGTRGRPGPNKKVPLYMKEPWKPKDPNDTTVTFDV